MERHGENEKKIPISYIDKIYRKSYKIYFENLFSISFYWIKEFL